MFRWIWWMMESYRRRRQKVHGIFWWVEFHIHHNSFRWLVPLLWFTWMCIECLMCTWTIAGDLAFRKLGDVLLTSILSSAQCSPLKRFWCCFICVSLSTAVVGVLLQFVESIRCQTHIKKADEKQRRNSNVNQSASFTMTIAIESKLIAFKWETIINNADWLSHWDDGTFFQLTFNKLVLMQFLGGHEPLSNRTAFKQWSIDSSQNPSKAKNSVVANFIECAYRIRRCLTLCFENEF